MPSYTQVSGRFDLVAQMAHLQEAATPAQPTTPVARTMGPLANHTFSNHKRIAASLLAPEGATEFRNRVAALTR